MIKLEKNMIDIGRDPAKAIEKISNPILDNLKDGVESDFQPKLESNMLKKTQIDAQTAEVNSNIYDEQMQ